MVATVYPVLFCLVGRRTSQAIRRTSSVTTAGASAYYLATGRSMRTARSVLSSRDPLDGSHDVITARPFTAVDTSRRLMHAPSFVSDTSSSPAHSSTAHSVDGVEAGEALCASVARTNICHCFDGVGDRMVAWYCSRLCPCPCLCFWPQNDHVRPLPLLATDTPPAARCQRCHLRSVTPPIAASRHTLVHRMSRQPLPAPPACRL